MNRNHPQHRRLKGTPPGMSRVTLAPAMDPLMPEKFEDIFSQEELESLLTTAISAWNPALPRRWLNLHGHLYDNARRGSPLYARYCALRSQALSKIHRAPVHHAQNWPANGLRVAL